jgi:uncharacterized membrane protein required for colicin V production
MAWLVILINILSIVVLVFSFIGGVKDGAVKTFFNLIAAIISIWLAGIYYHIIAGLLIFLPGDTWENLFGFFITFAIITVILHLIFLLPRKLIQKIWGKGIFYRIIGGIFGLVNAAIGLALFAIMLTTFPIFNWLAASIDASVVLVRIVDFMGFVQALLPELFRGTTTTVSLF